MGERCASVAASVAIVAASGFVILQEPWLEDTDRISRLLGHSVAEFNDRDLDCLDALQPTFVDETSRVGFDRLRAGIAWLVLREMHKGGSAPRWRLGLDHSGFGAGFDDGFDDGQHEIEVDAEAETATARFRLHLLDTRGGHESPAWSFDVTAHLELGDEGWRVARSTHDTTSGRRPW